MAEEEQPSIQYHEQPLSPEDYANIAKIVSGVNRSVSKQYPNHPPISPSQVKFVPDLSEVQNIISQTYLHPFFKELTSGKLETGIVPGVDALTSPDTKNVFFNLRALDILRQDERAVGYLGFGWDLIDASFKLAAETVEVKSPTATRLSIHSIKSSYQGPLKDIVSEEDLEVALQSRFEKGSHIRIRGCELTIMVENKMFMPPSGILSDVTAIRYLAKPVRAEFGHMIADEFGLDLRQKAYIDTAAQENPVSLTFPIGGNPEYDLLSRLVVWGFRNRTAVLEGYLNGAIGKKMIENAL